MDKELLQEFMAYGIISSKNKFDDYLPVALGIRRASQFIVPAELPDATILGATIDDRFRRKTKGRRLSGALGSLAKGRVGKFWRKSEMNEVRARVGALRGAYEEVVLGSPSYRSYMDWIGKLGLKSKELESRPTIREIYLYQTPSIEQELQELQDLRKDIRYEKLRTLATDVPVYARAFPEEQNPVYLKKLGTLLGFPLCCVDRYVFDRGSGVLSPEERASNQLTHLEPPEEYNIYAYFTKDFFPCQPDCPNAAAIGRAMHDRLKEIDSDIAEQFRKRLEENVALVRMYPEIIRKRIETLEQTTQRPQEGDADGEK